MLKKFFGKLFGGISSLSARRGPNDPKRYRIIRQIGQGTFGDVYEAKDRVTGALVAIKKLENSDDSNAEHEVGINKEIDHPNVVRMLGHFEQKRRANSPITEICLVLEYATSSLKDFIDLYRKKHAPMPPQMVRLLMFQMLRALNYLHTKKICHRDIKPSNLLVDQRSYVLKISDFGSAKRMVPGEPRCSIACSAPYRAPELELGNEDYNEKIDIWAAGCVVAECCTGEMLFRQVKGVKQYDLIRGLLGDPTPEDFAELQPLLPTPNLEQRCPPTIDQRFAQLNPPLPPTTITFLKKTLAYRPSKRPSAMQLMADPAFDPLRRMNGFDKLLYDFFEEEVENVPSAWLERIVPPRCRNEVVMQKLLDSSKTAQTASQSQPDTSQTMSSQPEPTKKTIVNGTSLKSSPKKG